MFSTRTINDLAEKRSTKRRGDWNLLIKGKIHRVDPKFTSWPSFLTENPHNSLRVDPNSGSTLWISGLSCIPTYKSRREPTTAAAAVRGPQAGKCMWPKLRAIGHSRGPAVSFECTPLPAARSGLSGWKFSSAHKIVYFSANCDKPRAQIYYSML
jgi:hypothetical protein